MFQRKKSASRACCLHFGRCGSTLLGNLLNSHSKIEWHGELLHPYHEQQIECDDPWQLITRPLNQCSLPTFGFEAKFQHLNHRGLDVSLAKFIDQLRDLGFNKFILLERQNLLRQAISVARGQQTRQWHVKNTASRPERVTIRLDVNRIALVGPFCSLLECFDCAKQSYSDVSEIVPRQEMLHLTYEIDLESNPMLGLRKATEFLGLKLEKATSSLQKISNAPISQELENFDEVKTILENTSYAWMLDG